MKHLTKRENHTVNLPERGSQAALLSVETNEVVPKINNVNNRPTSRNDTSSSYWTIYWSISSPTPWPGRQLLQLTYQFRTDSRLPFLDFHFPGPSLGQPRIWTPRPHIRTFY
ncbi:expressed unknown protein [Seminavis robusta]|uniref:Uncharacterized protein n=1 Tax=Seminavis robusta TaxID=568900 RepID=A0A9N8DL82_9STRA|nr:expressed unknown protein [Seminavis robusta]|eukprot:Sro191_g082361.1  (112) ;mRNA; r:81720-82055